MSASSVQYERKHASAVQSRVDDAASFPVPCTRGRPLPVKKSPRVFGCEKTPTHFFFFFLLHPKTRVRSQARPCHPITPAHSAQPDRGSFQFEGLNQAPPSLVPLPVTPPGCNNTPTLSSFFPYPYLGPPSGGRDPGRPVEGRGRANGRGGGDGGRPGGQDEGRHGQGDGRGDG